MCCKGWKPSLTITILQRDGAEDRPVTCIASDDEPFSRPKLPRPGEPDDGLVK